VKDVVGTDDEDVAEYDTLEEALAAAYLDADDGTEVAVHDETCALDEDEPCTCTPEVHVVRRGAA
jgi:hypothetical protein